MDTRINEGYVITDSIYIGETEFVFGKLDSKSPMYVTWACNGGNYYYWGHYFSDLMEAKADLLARAGQELKYQLNRKERADDPPKKQDKECER